MQKVLTLQPTPDDAPFSTALTAFNMTMIPSPMTINVSRRILSMRCVRLKPTSFQFVETPQTATSSMNMMGYHATQLLAE